MHSLERKQSVTSEAFGLHVSMLLPKCGLNYSRFMHGLSLAGVDLNRKILSEMAFTLKGIQRTR